METLSTPPSRSPRKKSPMPVDKSKRETGLGSRSRSPSHSSTSPVLEAKETAKENRKRHIQDMDLFNDVNEGIDSVKHREKNRHKLSKNSPKEREPEKESSGKLKSGKKEKSSKSGSSSTAESGHRRGKDLPELVSPKKESTTNNGSSSKSKTLKRDSGKFVFCVLSV